MTSLADQFLQGFDTPHFPKELMEKYEVLECLSHHGQNETFLIRHKKSMQHYIVKCHSNREEHMNQMDTEILKRIHIPEIPAWVEDFQNEDMVCSIRTYLPGKSLDQAMRENRLTQEKSLEITIQICDILNHLHTLTPPIIHRDLKPQNLILNEEGKIGLIDFGIARIYKKDAQEDTFFFGTKNMQHRSNMDSHKRMPEPIFTH